MKSNLWNAIPSPILLMSLGFDRKGGNEDEEDILPRRVEDVDVVENTVSITIISQTGLSKSHAKMTFDLNGRDIGSFRIIRDNYDTTIPEKIAEKIRIEIRKQVGLAA